MTALNFTNRCNARCAMCLENGNEKPFKPYSLEEAAGVLRQVGELNRDQSRSYLHLWGGEPFLDQDLLFGIVKAASGTGFKFIEIATNGFWGKDMDEARRIFAGILQASQGSIPAIQLSCDNLHQCQPILSPDHLANIIYLAKTEFPEVRIGINSILLNDSRSLHDVARSISRIDPGKVTAFYDEVEYHTFFFNKGDQSVDVRLTFFPLSLSGRCIPELSSQFGTRHYEPQIIAGIDQSPEHNISIGIDRQMYIFGSPRILPMGDIREFPLSSLIDRTEADPIAVSLMRHGYSEIYPHLNRLFDFDAWIRQFHSAYDVLQCLEADEPRLIG